MYELNGVTSSIIDSFYEAIQRADKHPHSTTIIPLAVKSAFHILEPNFPLHAVNTHLSKVLKPYFDRKRFGVYERPFENLLEAQKIYDDLFHKSFEILENDSSGENKNLIQVLDLIYDLLEYDCVVMIKDQPYLYSFINLYYWGKQHFKAINKRRKLELSKPAEENIDTALNTNKAYKDRTKFIPFPKAELNNPFLKNESLKLKRGIVECYPEEHKMLARSIYSFSQILREHSDIQFIKSFGELEPLVDSDAYISKKDIYESWYAYVVSIYRRSSKGKAPLKDVLKIAENSSYIVFPDIPKTNNFISLEKAKRPIREKSFFKGLRLCEFTDNRLKITRPKDEILCTETYLIVVTKELNRLSKS